MDTLHDIVRSPGKPEGSKAEIPYWVVLATPLKQMDEFRCHANNMNHLRQQYINILAELADSDVLSDLLSQLYGTHYPVTKLSSNLSALIRNSDYALC